MLENTRITFKYPLVIVTLALAAAFSTSYIAYTESSAQLQSAAERQLVVRRDSRILAITSYVETLQRELFYASSDLFIQQATHDFKIAWNALDTHDQQLLKKRYQGTENVSLKSRYDNAYQAYHPLLKNYQKMQGHNDIFLFDIHGNVIYSAAKQAEFTLNVNTEAWDNTSLAEVYNAVRDNPDPDFQAYSEFNASHAFHGEASSYAATAMIDRQGQLVGIIAIEVPISRINELMQLSVQLGNTGETYLVGSDLLMRSDSRFGEQSSILKTQADTLTARRALAGESGIVFAPNYRGVEVLSAYAPFDYLGSRWAVLAEVDKAEITAPLLRMQKLLIISNLLATVIISLIGIVVARRLSKPITIVANVISELANDDLKQRIPFTKRNDEIGQIGKALEVLKQHAGQRKQAERALINHQAMLAEAQIIANIGSWSWDIKNNEQQWSKQLFKIYGYEPMDGIPIQQSLERGIHPEDITDFRHFLAQSQTLDGSSQLEYRIIQPSGAMRLLRCEYKRITNNKGKVIRIVGTVLDITDARAAEEQIQYLANHDSLTDLPSLRLARDRLDSAFAVAQRHNTKVAVMFVDLDGFKLINDNHGHDAGDAVLIEIAKRLSQCVRKTDTVARIGGDEFLVIQVDIRSADASRNVAAKIIDVVSEPMTIGNEILSVGASVGIALYPDHGTDAETLLKKSDDAMYAVKRGGKNNFDFSNT